jgi:hypothetical protein
MQEYPVRATHRKGLTPESLVAACGRHFEGAAIEGDAVVAHWGAIEKLSTRAAGKSLGVELKMNPKVEESVARETIRRYNDFLQDATGFNAKERAKRLRKSPGE